MGSRIGACQAVQWKTDMCAIDAPYCFASFQGSIKNGKSEKNLHS